MDVSKTLELVPLIESFSQRQEIERALIASISIRRQEESRYTLLETFIDGTTKEIQTTISNALYACSCQRLTSLKHSQDGKTVPSSIFCKHVVYLCCTVAQLYDHHFYNKERKLDRFEARMLNGGVETLSDEYATAANTHTETVSQSQSDDTGTSLCMHVSQHDREDCPICLDQLDYDDRSSNHPSSTVHCLYCGRAYHRHCAKRWAEHSATCPYCRRTLQPIDCRSDRTIYGVETR